VAIYIVQFAVADNTGRPIAKATVVADGKKGTTGSNGAAGFWFWKSGTYSLSISKAGYDPYSGSFVLT
jgi:transcriptional/translational regulatory protein YebC/TACO1